MKRMAKSNFPLTMPLFTYKNKNVAIKMLTMPSVGAFVAACRRVYTSGKRKIPMELEIIKKVPANKRKIIIILMMRCIHVSIKDITFFNIFCNR